MWFWLFDVNKGSFHLAYFEFPGYVRRGTFHISFVDLHI